MTSKVSKINIDTIDGYGHALRGDETHACCDRLNTSLHGGDSTRNDDKTVVSPCVFLAAKQTCDLLKARFAGWTPIAIACSTAALLVQPVWLAQRYRNLYQRPACSFGKYFRVTAQRLWNDPGRVAANRGLGKRQHSAGICDNFDVTINTVRTLIKRAAAKAGVNRQLDLVRAVLTGPAVLASPAEPPSTPIDH